MLAPMSLVRIFLCLAFIGAAFAQCSHEDKKLKIDNNAVDPVSISCAATAAQFLAPIYSSHPMLKIKGNGNFTVSLFNSSNWAKYLAFEQGVECLNFCAVDHTGFFNSTLQWPYADTFHVLPKCSGVQTCEFEMYLRMDAPTATGGPGEPSGSAAIAPIVALLSILSAFVIAIQY